MIRHSLNYFLAQLANQQPPRFENDLLVKAIEYLNSLDFHKRLRIGWKESLFTFNHTEARFNDLNISLDFTFWVALTLSHSLRDINRVYTAWLSLKLNLEYFLHRGPLGNFLRIDRGFKTLSICVHYMAPMRAFFKKAILQKWPEIA